MDRRAARALLTPDVMLTFHRRKVRSPTCPSTQQLTTSSASLSSVFGLWRIILIFLFEKCPHQSKARRGRPCERRQGLHGCWPASCVNNARSDVTVDFPAPTVCEPKRNVCLQPRSDDVAGSLRGSCWNVFGGMKICCARIIYNFSPCTILLWKRHLLPERIEAMVGLVM
jgi:hypothetical protein